MLKESINKLVGGNDLSEAEAMQAIYTIMEGNATHAQIGSFLTALRIKGETVQEILGCAKAMREKAVKIAPNFEYYIDTCGTGGDGANTFNISTVAAIIAASCGVPVAKHGNRSVSSRSGSADVLEALGVNINLTPEQVQQCIEETNIGFMFAPTFHKCMAHAAPARREMGIRTVFNIAGPLTNPANAKGQLTGVYSRALVAPIANVLLNLGVEHAMVVHGSDGLDELTTTGETYIAEVKDGKVKEYTVKPADFGLNIASIEDLRGGSSEDNAVIIKGILKGELGAKSDIAVLNAAAALYIGKKCDSISAGVALAKALIESGRAYAKLEEFVDFTNGLK